MTNVVDSCACRNGRLECPIIEALDSRTERNTMQRKSLLIGLLLASLLSAVGLAAQSTKPAKKPPKIATTILQIEGMSCFACVARITKALNKVEGVTDVRISLQKREGEVQYRPVLVTPDSVARLVTALGYQAKVKGKQSP